MTKVAKSIRKMVLNLGKTFIFPVEPKEPSRNVILENGTPLSEPALLKFLIRPVLYRLPNFIPPIAFSVFAFSVSLLAYLLATATWGLTHREVSHLAVAGLILLSLILRRMGQELVKYRSLSTPFGTFTDYYLHSFTIGFIGISFY
ncbi:MAG: hypothetical protein KDD60_02980, partial [Bdellovibrionales bacterium]|nr:hypothetical protein [Bdellovibrionales bacterium]